MLPHFHFKTDTKSLRTVIKNKTENRNVKVQDLTPNPLPQLPNYLAFSCDGSFILQNAVIRLGGTTDRLRERVSKTPR